MIIDEKIEVLSEKGGAGFYSYSIEGDRIETSIFYLVFGKEVIYRNPESGLYFSNSFSKFSLSNEV